MRPSVTTGTPERRTSALLVLAVALSGLHPACTVNNPPTTRDQDEPAATVRLTVALQDGFADDLVVFRIDGREVFRKRDVTTKLLLGYAESFEVDVPPGRIAIEVELPDREQTERIELDVAGALYLGVRLEDGRVLHEVSERPFGYM